MLRNVLLAAGDQGVEAATCWRAVRRPTAASLVKTSAPAMRMRSRRARLRHIAGSRARATTRDRPAPRPSRLWRRGSRPAHGADGDGDPSARRGGGHDRVGSARRRTRARRGRRRRRVPSFIHPSKGHKSATSTRARAESARHLAACCRGAHACCLFCRSLASPRASRPAPRRRGSPAGSSRAAAAADVARRRRLGRVWRGDSGGRGFHRARPARRARAPRRRGRARSRACRRATEHVTPPPTLLARAPRSA